MLDETTEGSGLAAAHPKQTIHKRIILPRIPAGVEDALNLLTLWDLPELHEVFREQEISTRALQYLTDAEITELVPKIGPRTIFRAMLTKYRYEHQLPLLMAAASPIRATNTALVKRNYDNAFGSLRSDAIPQFVQPMKSEVDSVDLSENAWLDAEPDNSMYEDESLLEAMDNSCNSAPEGNEERDGLAIKERDPMGPQGNSTIIEYMGSNFKKVHFNFKDYNGERLCVTDLLTASCEGRCALDYYKENKFLDLKNRKRVVTVLIRAAVERRITGQRITAMFHDMTQQLLELFPNEKYETYFVPHRGQVPARGALYYKYSNYTRQLRRDGLLEYKLQKNRNDFSL